MGTPAGGGKAAGTKKVAGRKAATRKVAKRIVKGLTKKTYAVQYKGKKVRVSVPR